MEFTGLRFWIASIILFWALGYISSRLNADSQHIKVPKWLFYVCGAPHNSSIAYPSRLTRTGLAMQLLSFFILLFAVGFDLLGWEQDASKFAVIWLSLLCNLVVVRILARELRF